MSKRSQAYEQIIGRALTADLYEGLQPTIVSDVVYGAIEIDPALLTIKCLFLDTAALREAQENGTCVIIKQRILEALQKEGYPQKGVEGVSVGFASQQEVDEAGGPWHYFR
ncbi:MAG: hypothetical protein KDE51_00835 [Anaerolineales bacterium]|nr:hypothetical protein [Anaerolineales bacterium]